MFPIDSLNMKGFYTYDVESLYIWPVHKAY